MAEEEKPKKSLFGSAKKETKGASKAKDRETVSVEGLAEKLLDFSNIKGEIADLEALSGELHDEIKNVAKDKYIELYSKNGANPETFLIKDGEGCVMVLVTDKYKSIDEAKAKSLIEKFGKGIVEHTQEYYFDSAVLERNRDVIEEIIMGSDKISEKDKEDLIKVKESYSVKKGSIDKLKDFSEDLGSVISEIQPVFQLKNCGGKEKGMGGNLDDEEFERINEAFDDTYDEFLKQNKKIAKGGGVKRPSTFTNDKTFSKGDISVQRVGGSDMWEVAINGKPVGRVLGAQTSYFAIKKAEKQFN